MSGKILQINFKFSVSPAEYTEAVTPLAEPIAATPGMAWKVWIMNGDEREGGGVYLFESGAAVDAYLNSEIVAGIVSHPALSEFSVKQFDVMEKVTAVTRGPVDTAVAA